MRNEPVQIDVLEHVALIQLSQSKWSLSELCSIRFSVSRTVHNRINPPQKQRRVNCGGIREMKRYSLWHDQPLDCFNAPSCHKRKQFRYNYNI